MTLTYGSLFSGIGGIDVGLDRAGMRCAWQCEIDTKARDILARHWPEVPKYEDIRTLRGADLPHVDLICGGFPCQDLSVAGRRGGLAGERSGLWWEMARVISECRPRWVVAENVPGLLSACCPCPGTGEHDACKESHPIPGGSCPGGCMETHGGAMGAVLGSLVELGYGFAYASLDAQYFGVAQRRERVFIVGHLGAPWSASAQVLFESESCDGDTPPSRQTGARVAGSLAASAGSGGLGGVGQSAITSRIVETADTLRSHPRPGSNSNGGITLAPTLQGGGKRGYRVDAETAAGGAWSSARVSALTSSHGGADDNDAQAGHLVVTHKLTAEGADASEDGTAYALIPDAVGVAENQRGEIVETDIAHQLTAGGGKPGQGYAAARVADGVRRLTPLECERLMGLPDGFTDCQADSARYRQLGNAVVSNVADWIGKRIVAVDAGI